MFSGPYTGYVDHFTREKIAVSNNETYVGYDFHKNEEPSYLYPDKYSTHAYTQESEKIIKQHSKTKVCIMWGKRKINPRKFNTFEDYGDRHYNNINVNINHVYMSRNVFRHCISLKI